MITIVYGVESSIIRNFFVYKVSNYTKLANGSSKNQNIMELFFVDYSFFIFTQKKISYSWIDTSTDYIIRDLLTMHAGIKIEQFGKWKNANEVFENYYSPYWTINQNIQYLLPRTSCGDLGEKRSGLLFYSSTEDEKGLPLFNLIPLQELLNQRELLKVNGEDTGQYYLFNTENKNNMNKILDWEISSLDKTAFNIIMGGKMIGFNQKSKEKIEKSYKYNELIKNTVILGKYSLFPDISDDKCYIGVCGDGDESRIDNLFYDEWIKKYCLQQLVTITLLGHEKRSCGKMIEIPWSKNKTENGTSNSTTEFDMKMAGGYLIKSVTHYFSINSPGYYQKLVLIKNGFNDVQSDQIMIQENENLRNLLSNNYDQLAEQSRNDSIFNESKKEEEESGLQKVTEDIVDTAKNGFLDWILGK